MIEASAFSKVINSYSKRRYEISGETFQALQEPVVYIVYGENEVLYVGQSTKGAGRSFEKNHHAMSLISEPIMYVHVFIPDHPDDINLLEQYLIREFQPLYNQTYKKRKMITSSKHWQNVYNPVDKLRHQPQLELSTV